MDIRDKVQELYNYLYNREIYEFLSPNLWLNNNKSHLFLIYLKGPTTLPICLLLRPEKTNIMIQIWA